MVVLGLVELWIDFECVGFVVLRFMSGAGGWWGIWIYVWVPKAVWVEDLFLCCLLPIVKVVMPLYVHCFFFSFLSTVLAIYEWGPIYIGSEDHVDVIFGGWRDVCLGWDDLFLWYACVTCVFLMNTLGWWVCCWARIFLQKTTLLKCHYDTPLPFTGTFSHLFEYYV